MPQIVRVRLDHRPDCFLCHFPIDTKEVIRIVWESRIDEGVTQIGYFHLMACGPAMIAHLKESE